MADLTSWCRGCDSLCGLLVRTANGRLAEVGGDPGHPLSEGHDCAHGRGAPFQVNRPDRLTAVKGRGASSGAGAASWDVAMDDLSQSVRAALHAGGPGAVGLLLGPGVVNSQRLQRSVAALRVAAGEIPVFTAQARVELPMAQAARLVLGRAVYLRADLARAHHVLMLGGNQLDQGWTPGHAGQVLLARLRGSGRGRPRITVADPRGSSMVGRADQHLRLRPGSELYLLLGLASALLRGGWVDRQHLRQRCDGLEVLGEALASWSPARAAELCGISVAEISAEALRLSRSPTAAILVSPQALGTPWSTLTAWAVLVIHALTNNLLEPGGLFAHPGALIPSPSLRALPDSALIGALRRRLRVLICVEPEPVEAYPGTLGPQLDVLERLVCLDRLDHSLGRCAHWVLPSTHHLEEPDLGWGDRCDRHWLQWSSGLVVPPQACRAPWRVLDDLCARLGSGRETDHGRAEREAVAVAASARPEAGSTLLDHVHPGFTRAADLPRGFDGGPVDRATWIVALPGGRQQLAPAPMLAALERHEPVVSARYPLRLVSSARRDPARGPWERAGAGTDAGVSLHPSLGFAEGQPVRIVSPHGSCTAQVRLDPELEPSAVDCPVGFAAQPMALVDPTHLDPWADTAWTDGQPCRVEASSPAATAPKPLA